jgi:hypothetical protein
MRLGQSRGIIKAVETVYVALRDEGVDVWRPVEAERISESVYRLANVSVPDAEEWEFSPGRRCSASCASCLMAGRLWPSSPPSTLASLAHARALNVALAKDS